MTPEQLRRAAAGQAARRRARLTGIPGLRRRLDAGLVLTLAGLTLGLGALGWLTGAIEDARGFLDPPLLQAVPERRLLADYRDGEGRFVDVLATGRGLALARSGGEVLQYDPAPQLFSSSALPRDGRLGAPLWLLSEACDTGARQGGICTDGLLLAVTGAGGLASRLPGQDWQVRLSDRPWLGPDGLPVQSADLTAWAVEDTGRHVAVLVGAKGIGLFDQQTGSWQALPAPGAGAGPGADPRAGLADRIVPLGQGFLLGGPTGLELLTPGPDPSRRAVEGLQGEVLDLEVRSGGGALVLWRGACGAAPDCLSIGQIDSRGRLSRLVGETARHPGLSGGGLSHAALQDGRLVVLGTAGVHVYDPSSRDWRELLALPPDAIFAGPEGREILVAAGTDFLRVRGGAVAGRLQLPQRMVQILGTGRAVYGLAGDGSIHDLGQSQPRQVRPVDSGAPEGTRFLSAAAGGDLLAWLGPGGILLHDVQLRRYAWHSAASLGLGSLSENERILGDRDGFWIHDPQAGTFMAARTQGEWPDPGLALSGRISIGEGFAAPRAGNGRFEAVTRSGRPFMADFSQPERLMSPVGDPLSGNFAASAVATAPGGLVFAAGSSLARYDLDSRTWEGVALTPGSPVLDLAHAGGVLALTADGRLWAESAAGGALVMGGAVPAAVGSAAISDALVAGGVLYMGGDGAVAGYDPEARGFVSGFAGGSGPVRLVADGQVPVWVSGGALFKGAVRLDPPGRRVLGAFGGPEGAVALVEGSDGRRLAWHPASGRCLYAGAEGPGGAMVDVQPLPGGRLAVQTETALAIHDPAARRWIPTRGGGAPGESRLEVFGDWFLRLGRGGFQAMPLADLPAPASCDPAPQDLVWPQDIATRQQALDPLTGRIFLLDRDLAVAVWSGGQSAALLPPPSALAPDPAGLRRVWPVPAGFAALSAEGVWTYDTGRRTWSLTRFLDPPAGITEMDMAPAPGGGWLVTLWTADGRSFGGHWDGRAGTAQGGGQGGEATGAQNGTQNAGPDGGPEGGTDGGRDGAGITLGQLRYPAQLRTGIAPQDILDMAAEAGVGAVIAAQGIEVFRQSAPDQTGFLDLSARPGPRLPTRLSGRDVLVSGDLDAPQRLEILSALPEPGQRLSLQQVAASYTPGDDRGWSLAGDGLLYRIDSAGQVLRCTLRTGAEPDCGVVAAAPLPIDAPEILGAAAGGRVLLTRDALFLLDAARRPAARLPVGPGARLFSVSGSALLWEGPGGALLRLDGAEAKPLLAGVTGLRRSASGLVAEAGGRLHSIGGAGPPGPGAGLTALTLQADGSLLALNAEGLPVDSLGRPAPQGIALPRRARALFPLVLDLPEAPATAGYLVQMPDGRLLFRYASRCSLPSPDPRRGGAGPAADCLRQTVLAAGVQDLLLSAVLVDGAEARAATGGPASGPAGEQVPGPDPDPAVTGRPGQAPDPATGPTTGPASDTATDPAAAPVTWRGLGLLTGTQEYVLDMQGQGLRPVGPGPGVPEPSPTEAQLLAAARALIAAGPLGPEYAPPRLLDAGARLDTGSGMLALAGSNRPALWRPLALPGLAWSRERRELVFGTGAPLRLPPGQAFRDGRLITDQPYRAAYLGGDGHAVLNASGLWRLVGGTRLEPVRLMDLPLAAGLAHGRFLLPGAEGVDLRSGERIADTDAFDLRLGPLALTERLRGGGLNALYDLDTGAAPAFAARGFAVDERLGIGFGPGAGAGEAWLLTPVGLVPAQRWAAGRAVPPGTRGVETIAGRIAALAGDGWKALDGGGWTDSPGPDAEALLALHDGLEWWRSQGGLSVRDPVGGAPLPGLDLPRDRLLAMAATRQGIVVVDGLGTRSAPGLAALAQAPVLAAAPGGLTALEAQDLGQTELLWAQTASGPLVWDPASGWTAPAALRPWEGRRIDVPGGLELTLGPQGAAVSVTMAAAGNAPADSTLSVPLTWARGGQMPIDIARSLHAEGNVVLVGTELGLRRLQAAGGGLQSDLLIADGAIPGPVTTLGRPSADPARLLALGPGGICLEFANPGVLPTPCASPASADPLLVLADGFWAWEKSPGRIRGAYQLADGQQIPVDLPLRGTFAHDRLRARASCGPAYEVWADRDVVVRRSGGQVRLDRVPGASDLHCQERPAALGGGASLAQGVYLQTRDGVLAATQTGWDPRPAGTAAAVAERRSGRIVWSSDRMRYGIGDAGALAQHLWQDGVWRDLAWRQGLLEVDQVLALAQSGGEVQALTPAGFVPLPLRGGRLLLDPARLRLAVPADPRGLADCLPLAVETRDGSVQGLAAVPGGPVALSCTDGRLWQADLAGGADLGAVVPTADDPFAQRSLIGDADWTAGRRRSAAGFALDLRFRGEAMPLAAGRFAADDYRALAAPFAGEVELLAADGWRRHSGGRLALSSGRRPEAALDPHRVQSLSRDLDPGGAPGLCLTLPEGARLISATGGMQQVEACLDHAGQDAVWRYGNSPAGPLAFGEMANGGQKRRRFEDGRFADLIVSGAPLGLADGTMMVPTLDGALALGPEGPRAVYGSDLPGAPVRLAGGGAALLTTGGLRVLTEGGPQRRTDGAGQQPAEDGPGSRLPAGELPFHPPAGDPLSQSPSGELLSQSPSGELLSQSPSGDLLSRSPAGDGLPWPVAGGGDGYCQALEDLGPLLPAGLVPVRVEAATDGYIRLSLAEAAWLGRVTLADAAGGPPRSGQAAGAAAAAAESADGEDAPPSMHGAEAAQAGPGQDLPPEAGGRLWHLLVPCAAPHLAIPGAERIALSGRARFQAHSGSPAVAGAGLIAWLDAGRLWLTADGHHILAADGSFPETPLALVAAAEGDGMFVLTPNALYRLDTDRAISALAGSILGGGAVPRAFPPARDGALTGVEAPGAPAGAPAADGGPGTGPGSVGAAVLPQGAGRAPPPRPPNPGSHNPDPPGPGPADPGPPARPGGSAALVAGLSAAEIGALEQALSALGHLRRPPGNSFDSLSAMALRSWRGGTGREQGVPLARAELEVLLAWAGIAMPPAGAVTPAVPVPHPAPLEGYTAAEIREAQQHLRRLGHYQGLIDGIFGPQSRAALQAWQAQRAIRIDLPLARVDFGRLGQEAARVRR